ncbi:MAG: hypothetical protein V1944_00090 [Candidatus Aenigmatarchaeota archaeon]
MSWTYSLCDTCLKNAHEEVLMKREKFASTYDDVNSSEEYWICPKCGSCKKL